MTFVSIEESRYLGIPIELYKFTYGPAPGDIYTYTNAEEPVEVAGVVYTPLPIQRDTVKSSGTLDKTAMSINMPASSDVANLFIVTPPSYVVSLTIWQGHYGDGDFRACWTGRILGAAWQGSTFTATCEPVAASLKRTGLRRHYQYGCPHVLFGPGCNANKTAATTTVTVSAINGNKITLLGGWAADDMKVKHVGGLVTWSNGGRQEVRTIMKVNGPTNVLTCSGIFPGLALGDPVDITLGCNRQMSDCANLHANIKNFGGCPWIPKKNPIGVVNNYY